MSQFKYISTAEGSEVEIDDKVFRREETIGTGKFGSAGRFQCNDTSPTTTAQAKPFSFFPKIQEKYQFVVIKSTASESDQEYIEEAKAKLLFFQKLYPHFPSKLIMLENKRYRLILPFLPGLTYQVIRKNFKRFSILDQYNLFFAAAKAVYECHQKTNRVILDLKWDNILYVNHYIGTAYLIDGGISVLSETLLKDYNSNNFAIRTPHCAPELWYQPSKGGPSLAHFSMDVYSLGFLMDQMFSPHCDSFLADLIKKCLSKEPGLRPLLVDIIEQIEDRLLHIVAAAPKNSSKEIALLLEKKYDINALHPQWQISPIYFAAQSGSLKTFQLLVKNGAHLDASIFKFLKQNKSIELMEFVTDPRNKIIDKFTDGTTYLHAAIMFNDIERTQKILESDPTSISITNHKKQTPLYLAASLNLQKIVNLITTHKNFNQTLDDKYRGEAEYLRLTACEINNNLQIINNYLRAINNLLFIEEKTDTDYCWLALLATECSVISSENFDISQAQSDILRAIEYCKKIKDTRLRDEHLYFYGEINSCKKKTSAFVDVMTLSISKGYLDPVIYWLNHKSTYFLSSSGNNKFLFTAIQFGHEAIVSHLIKNRFDLNEPLLEIENNIHIKKSPLFYATEHKKTNIIRLLLASKAETRTSGTLFSAIHLATKMGDLDMIKCFIEFRPSLLEQKDSYGQTPLLWAANIGHVNIVSYLLKIGADLKVSTKNKGHCDDGKTAIDWAIENNHYEVANLLLQRLNQQEVTKNNNNKDEVMIPQDDEEDSGLSHGPKSV